MENQLIREITAKSVEEAIEVAMHELDVGRDEIEIEILNSGRTGFLGIGSELAKIRARKLSAHEDAGARAMEVVSRILSFLSPSATCTLKSAHNEESGGPLIDIDGEDSGLLIGRRGETLRALQMFVNIIVNKQRDKLVRIQLDVQEYRKRKDTALSEMARRVADKVTATGRSITLEPMGAAERRIVHVTLADDPKITTLSDGSGNDRRVAINPKRD